MKKKYIKPVLVIILGITISVFGLIFEDASARGRGGGPKRPGPGNKNKPDRHLRPPKMPAPNKMAKKLIEIGDKNGDKKLNEKELTFALKKFHEHMRKMHKKNQEDENDD